jgi:hypothetical protein
MQRVLVPVTEMEIRFLSFLFNYKVLFQIQVHTSSYCLFTSPKYVMYVTGYKQLLCTLILVYGSLSTGLLGT